VRSASLLSTVTETRVVSVNMKSRPTGTLVRLLAGSCSTTMGEAAVKARRQRRERSHVVIGR
jgi:hypothetical protein